LQAKFLNGTLTEGTFRRKMGDSPQWRATAQYAIGLTHWLQGDISFAVRAFEPCPQTDIEKNSPIHNPLKIEPGKIISVFKQPGNFKEGHRRLGNFTTY